MGLQIKTTYTDGDLVELLLGGEDGRVDLSEDEINKKFDWVEVSITNKTEKKLTARVAVDNDDDALDLCLKYGLLLLPKKSVFPSGLKVSHPMLSSRHVSVKLIHISVSQVVEW